MCRELCLLLLMLSLMVVEAVVEDESDAEASSGSTLPDVDIHPDQEMIPIDQTNTNNVQQNFASSGDGGEDSSEDTSAFNTAGDVLPTPQPLVQYRYQSQHINRQPQLNRRQDDMRYFQQLMRIRQYPLSYNQNQQHQLNLASQEYINHAHGYLQNQQMNLKNSPLTPERQNTWDSGSRGSYSLSNNHFSPPYNTQRLTPITNHRPPYFPRQRQDIPLEKYKLLSEKQSEPHLSKPGPELSIHDLTSNFYQVNKIPLLSSVLQASSTHNTNRINNQPVNNFRAPISKNTQRSFGTNNKRQFFSLQPELAYPRPPPKTHYPPRNREIPEPSNPQEEHTLYDPERYPPSMSFGQPYFTRDLSGITSNQQEAGHGFGENRVYKPNIYNWKNQYIPRLRNNYRSNPHRRQFSQSQFSAVRNLDTPTYQNVKQTFQTGIKGLNYAQLPSGYASPTTTFEKSENKEKRESNHSNAMGITNLEQAEKDSTVLFNGHGGPPIIN
ncbi:uncharacterized protein LOC121871736 isoform X2 [Homarus americanus]|nr:uncharacterized protein LOC121871736 isoform X2 [Homarus americanus]